MTTSTSTSTTHTTGSHSAALAAWAARVPDAPHTTSLTFRGDALAAAVGLVTSGLGSPYVLYERDSLLHVAAGAAGLLRMTARHLTAEAQGGSWTLPVTGPALAPVTEAFEALSTVQAGVRGAYGWAAFELAHLLHGAGGSEPSLSVPAGGSGGATPLAGDPSGLGDLLCLFIPAVEVVLSPGEATVSAVSPHLLDTAARLLTAPSARRAPGPATPVEAGDGDPEAYRTAVAKVIGDIRAGRLDKAVLSRTVPLDGAAPVDLPATYLAGLAANTPARSFLLDLGGWQAAGFSPETVVEAVPGGRVTTQPLAGTRALSQDPAENHRLRAELLADPKEVHEHAVSVRLACQELGGVCATGSVLVEEFMAVRERGSVQHLASRVAGRLREDRGPWDAFAALFPAVTATGAPKTEALAALQRYEDGPRGLYGGAVITADTAGALDAALVLRTVFRRGERTWLRAGAGIMRDSTPDREFEETCEKLRSVAPHIRRRPRS
ncbi:salicylate synthase [Streptomyces sp. TS71-3]|uniref:salicylate synthase n=1 Tax=Streptomyces sp. TS71-3 TaxID=2733862 RepID=UPI001B0C955F|nr:salicylate synthase [Streptomyces sp. TS71-3]GHJ35176.1 salicylate synthase [Streptomyces sp. TS71-3]